MLLLSNKGTFSKNTVFLKKEFKKLLGIVVNYFNLRLKMSHEIKSHKIWGLFFLLLSKVSTHEQRALRPFAHVLIGY